MSSRPAGLNTRLMASLFMRDTAPSKSLLPGQGGISHSPQPPALLQHWERPRQFKTALVTLIRTSQTLPGPLNLNMFIGSSGITFPTKITCSRKTVGGPQKIRHTITIYSNNLGKPVVLQSMGSQRVRYNLATERQQGIYPKN